MTDKLLSILKNKYPLVEMDAGTMASLKANGMTFTVKAYKAKGLGHVSVMRAKGFCGLMKMDTLIVELYDTLIGKCELEALNKVKEDYAELSERDPGTHWYDSIKLAESISKKGKKKQHSFLEIFYLELVKCNE